MDVNARQSELISELLQAAIEWGVIHNYLFLTNEHLDELQDFAMDDFLDMHRNGSDPVLFSDALFQNLSWSRTRIGYPENASFVIEHLLFAFDYLMPLASLLQDQINRRGPLAIATSDELVWEWWDNLPALKEQHSEVEYISKELWAPMHIQQELINDEMCWSMTFDIEVMPFPQLHAFFRLFIDTYLTGLGIEVNVLLIAERNSSIAVSIFEAQPGHGELALSTIG